MENIVDTRGLSCPQPVIKTLDKIKELGSGEIVILADTDTAKENIIRAIITKGWAVGDIRPEDEGYRIIIRK